jgi:hypothetical protein
MLNLKDFHEAVLFDLIHYGTKTQGEDYRLEQVADKIVQLCGDALIVQEALMQVQVQSMITFTVK